MVIVQASNIHVGGGAVLLTDLLKAMSKRNMKVLLYVDSRYRCDSWSGLEIVKVKASVFSRLKVEYQIQKAAKTNPNAAVLFFGNLPPLLGAVPKSILFFQNFILLDAKKSQAFGLKTRLKHFIERAWLSFGISHVERVFVQSETVKRQFLKSYSEARIEVCAFSDVSSAPAFAGNKSHDFIYVASGDPHKNHLNLIRAWILLKQAGLTPKLTLTAQSLSASEQEILERAQKEGAHIELKPDLAREEALALYTSAKALIFPSFTESFGLPLVEAKAADLPILASELDYVRDLVDPAETFDPASELSIARAVQRFLKTAQSGKTSVNTADAFIEKIL